MTEQASNGIAVQPAGVTKTCGGGRTGVQELPWIDLEVRTGEVMMLAGPSSIRKSKLISGIAVILDKTDGDCREAPRHGSHTRA